MKEYAGSLRDYKGLAAKDRTEPVVKGFNWILNIFIAVVGLGMISAWGISLTPIAVATLTHDAIVLPQPPDLLLAGLTFVMLGGVALVAIQVAKMVEKILAH